MFFSSSGELGTCKPIEAGLGTASVFNAFACAASCKGCKLDCNVDKSEPCTGTCHAPEDTNKDTGTWGQVRGALCAPVDAIATRRDRLGEKQPSVCCHGLADRLT